MKHSNGKLTLVIVTSHSLLIRRVINNIDSSRINNEDCRKKRGFLLLLMPPLLESRKHSWFRGKSKLNGTPVEFTSNSSNSIEVAPNDENKPLIL